MAERSNLSAIKNILRTTLPPFAGLEREIKKLLDYTWENVLERLATIVLERIEFEQFVQGIEERFEDSGDESNNLNEVSMEQEDLAMNETINSQASTIVDQSFSSMAPENLNRHSASFSNTGSFYSFHPSTILEEDEGPDETQFDQSVTIERSIWSDP